VQLAQLEAGKGVQEGEQPDQRFVGMDAGVGGPPLEQAALFGLGECLAGEAVAGLAWQVPGRVDQDDLVLAGPGEELACCLQPTTTVAHLLPQERFDVADVDDRPVLLGSLFGQEPAHIPDDAEVVFDGVVGPGAGAGPSGPFLGADQVVAESGHRGPQGDGDGADPALPAAVGETGLLVETEGESLADKELFQCPR
jgi:hypothetical protein